MLLAGLQVNLHYQKVELKQFISRLMLLANISYVPIYEYQYL